MVKSSGETEDPQTEAYKLTVEMANSSCGTEPKLKKFKSSQPECEAVQLNEPDEEISINAAEQGAVSCPVVIQDNALSDRLQSADVHGSVIDASLVVFPPEVEQTNVSIIETEELSTDIKNKPQHRQDLEGPIIKLDGNLDELENETKTGLANPNHTLTSSPDPKTSLKDQSSQKPSQSHFLHVNGEDMLFHKIDHPERFLDVMLEDVEETCFSGEMHLHTTDETDALEPPAKKRLRKRMGMCGLGDKKRKLPFDGQHCRQGLLGINKGEGDPKCNKDIQNLYDTMLKNDDSSLMDHDGSTGPTCDEIAEWAMGLESSGAAVMNNDKYIALMNDRATTDESLRENGDVLKKGTLQENNETIITDDKLTNEQVVFSQRLTLLEEISSTMAKNFTMIQDELPVVAASSDQEMETASCAEEPNFSGIKRTNRDEVLSQKQNHHTDDDKLDEKPNEISTQVKFEQDVICGVICPTVEMPEGSVITSKEVIQSSSTGLEECKIEIEEADPLSSDSSEKPDTNGLELFRDTEKVLDPLYVDIMSIFHVASSYETQRAKDKSITAVPERTEPAGGDTGDVETSGPLAPPTGQEHHIQCCLDSNACDTSVTPTDAEQQDCNPNQTPAAIKLNQETDMSPSPWLNSMTDSQIHKIALSMELEDQPVPESWNQPEDATELIRGLIRELSSLNRTVMAAHREMELMRRGKLPKASKPHLCGPHNTEK